MKYRYLLSTLSLIIAILGCNLPSNAPSIGEASSLLTNTPAQPVDAPLPLVTPLLTDSQAQPPPPTASEVQPPAQQQPQPNPAVGCNGTPNISFTASRTTITVGGSTTLSWTVTNSDARQIDNGVGNDVQASDSRNVSPGEGRTTYTLTARCGNNTATKQVTVVVNGVGAGLPDAPEAPGKPQGFTAQGIGTKITFSWTGVSGVSYKVYMEGQTEPVVPNPTGTTLTITRDCNLKAKFFVRAVNSGGESPDSDHIEAVTVPCKPTNFTAEGSGATITFRWGDTANETGFFIYRQSGGQPFQSGTNTTSFVWNSIPCNTGDNFYVSAVNSAGESAGSNQFEAVTVPCAPTIQSAIANSQTSVNVGFTDTATSESGFHIYRTGNNAILGTVPAIQFTGRFGTGLASQLICGQKYSYYVKAYNTAGESVPSATKDATTSACTVTVTFDSLYVFDDLNVFGPGQFYCGLISSAVDPGVNAIPARRWPNSGYIEIETNREKPINITMNGVNLLRTQDLFLTVFCQRQELLGESGFGGYSNRLGSENWSTRQLCTVSNDVEFRICFTITVTP